MGGGEATAPLDRRRLERVLAPFAARSGGPSVSVVDTAGVTIAGRDVPADGAGNGLSADVVVDGTIVARVVASGGSDPGLRAAIDALAIALGELVTESIERTTAEQALGTHRSQHTAESLGIDTAELAKGRRQQRSIVSLEAPDVPGYDLASHYAPARDIGGDFFELFRLPRRGHPLAIVVADVTGKGLDAALLMAFARPVMHSALDASRGPAEAIDRTNRVLVAERRATLFITLLCAILQPTTGHVRRRERGPRAAAPRPRGRRTDPRGGQGRRPHGRVRLDLAAGDRAHPGAWRHPPVLHGRRDRRRVADRRAVRRRAAPRDVEAARDANAHDLVAAVRDRVRAFQQTADAADDVTLVAVGRRPRRRRRPG